MWCTLQKLQLPFIQPPRAALQSHWQCLVYLHAILWDCTRCQEALCLSAVVIHPATGIVMLQKGEPIEREQILLLFKQLLCMK